MPIYPYECVYCGHTFERIEKVTKYSWDMEKIARIQCPNCARAGAKKVVAAFKVGSKILETTGKSGYETDDFTLGKLIDEGGLPYEEKNRLRERGEMIDRQKKYSKELKRRSEAYNFDPFSD